jgi:S1-C subfamily serine protease
MFSLEGVVTARSAEGFTVRDRDGRERQVAARALALPYATMGDLEQVVVGDRVRVMGGPSGGIFLCSSVHRLPARPWWRLWG